MQKLLNFAIIQVKHEGFLWALWNFVGRIRIWLRSQFTAIALDAKGLHLGGKPIIRGSKYIKFGKNIHIGGSIWIEAITKYGGNQYAPRIEIGSDTSFSEGVHITCIDNIKICSNVLIGSRVYISDHGHGVYKGTNQSSPNLAPTQRQLGGGGAVFIDENAWIGDNVVIIGPVRIGRGAVIGANSVVRNDIPANCIVAGAPAKIIKKYDVNTSQWIQS